MKPSHNVLKTKNNKYFTDNIPIMDGMAYVHKTPRSGGVWQMRMWVKEEDRHVRKSLRTKDLDEALQLAKHEVAQILGMTATGKRLFGLDFGEAAKQWLEVQKDRVSTNRITDGRYKTLKTQINRHIVPYIREKEGKKVKIGTVSFNSFYDFAQYRRKNNPEVEEVTIRNEHTTIGSFIKWAFRQGHTNFDSCEFEEIKIRQAVRRDTFSLDEYETLYRYMRRWVKEEPEYRTAKSNMMPLKKKNFFRDMILLNSNNLLRVGEIRQLKWGMTRTFKKGKEFFTHYNLPAEICKNRKSRVFMSRGGAYLNRWYADIKD